MFKSYLLQNWVMLLVLAAFAIALHITVFLDKKTIRRMYVLIVAVFLLSLVVFVEFYSLGCPEYNDLRTVLMAIRYSATPLIIAQIIYTLVKKQGWYVFIPAIIHTGINVISIFTGIVFSIGADGLLVRGFLGYLPFIMTGVYCCVLIYLLVRRSNNQWVEIAPIIFLCFAFASSLIFPFVFGSDFSSIFCSIIAVALFVYYVFSILDQTKKDSLTGLLNRHAFKADMHDNPKEITALLSIDMNGLKTLNDEQGHAVGDDALTTLALCFTRSLNYKEHGYRIGGDEFVIICRRISRGEMMTLVERIKGLVEKTDYSCSIGYSFNDDEEKDVDEMLKEADEMMYADKALYYQKSGIDRRRT